MSNQLPPEVRHVLAYIAGVAVLALCVAILVGRDNIICWWRNSPTLSWLRWRAGDLRAAVAYPFRLLCKRSPKITAGAGASPTLLPPVSPRPVSPRRDMR